MSNSKFLEKISLVYHAICLDILLKFYRKHELFVLARILQGSIKSLKISLLLIFSDQSIFVGSNYISDKRRSVSHPLKAIFSREDSMHALNVCNKFNGPNHPIDSHP